MTQNTGESNLVAAFPRQTTFQINEEILPSQPSGGQGSRADIKVTSQFGDSEDVMSDTKTISQSKSQAAKQYAIN